MTTEHHCTPRGASDTATAATTPAAAAIPTRRRRSRRALFTASAVALVGSVAPGASPAAATPTPTATTAVVASAPTTDRTSEPVYDPYAGTQAAAEPIGHTLSGQITTPDGRTRTYRVYVPASLPAFRPAPLLIALHGGMGSAEQFQANSGFDGLAEANRFIVVYPDGVGMGRWFDRGPQTWNGGYCCGPAVARNVDDVGFIRQLIDTMQARYRIDRSRVVVSGHSNGAILAYRLACELSDSVVAIGVQAGSLGVPSCTPRRPVAVFHLHGTADTNHPIDGGFGNGLAQVNFRSAISSVTALAEANRCIMRPQTTAVVTPSNPDLTVTTWSRCLGNAEVRFVAVAGASHAWMGHPATSPDAERLVGRPYPDLDASRAIWSFLASHPRN